MVNVSQFKETMEKINERLKSEKSLIMNTELSVESSDYEYIDALIKKSEDATFRLLVVGQFSSGKSSLINVLLGENILPEKVIPTTAIISEIYYGEEKKVIIYPRKGKWAGGDEPFEIEPTLKEIERYSTLSKNIGFNTIDGVKVESVFEKMVIYWPLDILKNGVSIVDSPGTNDPDCHDYIVENYLKEADATLYVMNGTLAYGNIDKIFLNRLNTLGYKPIIATTYFDVITAGKDKEVINECTEVLVGNYQNHTTEDFCYFLDSLSGLEAKKTKNLDLLERSGYSKFEAFIGRYLSEDVGMEKINAIAEGLKRSFNSTQKKNINGVLNNIDLPLEEFEERLANAENDLKAVEERGEIILKQYHLELDKARDNIAPIASRLYDYIVENINLDDYDPEENFSIWHPKKTSEILAKSCVNEIENRIKLLIEQWVAKELNPALKSEFKKIVEKLQVNIDSFEDEIKNININFGSINKNDNNKELKDRVSSVAYLAYAIYTGDILTALTGGVFGLKGIGRNLISNFIAAIAFVLVGFFTPVGLVELTIAVIAAQIGATGWNISKATKAIKKETLKAAKNHIEENKELIMGQINAECTKIFDETVHSMEKSIKKDIEDVSNIINNIKTERTISAEKIEERKKELNDLLIYIQETEEFIDNIVAKSETAVI